jgi:hypothetical protein
MCIPKTTIAQHFTWPLRFLVRHLHWFSHSLTDAQKPQRVTLWNELSCWLRSSKHHSWQFIITLDELWLYFTADHEQTWPPPEQEPPERPGRTI